MKCGKLLSAFLLLLIVLSLVTLINPKANLIADFSTSLSTQSLVQMSLNYDASLLNQSTRIQIYNFITNTPGINFRGICNYLALPIGVVQYHLAVLMKGGFISNRRDGRNKRYFESRKFSSNEMRIISVLRRKTAGKILTILHNEKSVSHGIMAERLNISSQALTWHMKQLQEENLVTGQADGITVRYSINEEFLATLTQCIQVTV
ncbi:MAG: winged helix-turn-helix transcriptional regulator [Candidatus Bathyarchaeota archaeon]|nr:winged helix-turn-helix transcriptional regulator [Candidatus Bathyarchaeum sp.]